MKKILLPIFIITTFLITAALSEQKIEQLKNQLTAMGVKKSSISYYTKAVATKSVVEAESLLRKAIKADPNNSFAKDELASIYMHMEGKEKEVAQLLEDSIGINFRNHNSYESLLNVYAKLNDEEGYERTLMKFRENMPDYPEGYRFSALFERSRKNYEKAGEYIDKVIVTYQNINGRYPEILEKRDALLSEIYALRVVNLIDSGQYQNAINSFVNTRKYIALNSEHEKGLVIALQNVNETFKENRKVYEENLKLIR